MKNNNRGFTLVELLAVIVILGLLMAIAIPSVTKYITQSRVKTLISTMDSYVTAVVTSVNNGEYKFSDSTKVFAIPIECISLEKGGANPFGNWYQANSAYWAYVLVHYDNDTYNYQYGFTFKDDAGYGLYPTLNSLITNSMVKTGYDDLNQPKDGLALNFVSIDKWEGFSNINSSTMLEVLVSESDGVEGDGQYTCTLCQKGDNYEVIEEEKNKNKNINNVVPEGGEYTPVDGEKITPNGELPEEPKDGDVFVYGDYRYTYKAEQNGWWVMAANKNKTSYGYILGSIAGKPITDMRQTFAYIYKDFKLPDDFKIPETVISMEQTFIYSDLTSLPPNLVIPSSVTNLNETFSTTPITNIPDLTQVNKVSSLYRTFYGTAITTIPYIPVSVTSLYETFQGCSKLSKYLGMSSNVELGDFSNYQVPVQVTDMSRTFAGCTSMKYGPKLPPNVTNLSQAFYNSGLVNDGLPEIPYGVTNLNHIFSFCQSLTDVSNYVIPSTVTDLSGMFYYSKNLKVGMKIPNTVTSMSMMYYGCISLVDVPEIPSSVSKIYHTFYNCTSLKKAPKIHNRATDVRGAFSGCTSLTGFVEIDVSFGTGSSAAYWYSEMFENVDFEKQNLILTGKSTSLDLFGATGLNYK